MLRSCDDTYASPITVLTQADFQVRRRQQISYSLRPFHQTNVIGIKVLPEACIHPFLGIIESIKIKVI